MSISLRPLNPNPDRDLFRFAVCDIEATKWINFLTIGYYTKHFNQGEFTHDEYHHFENLSEFCDFCFEDQTRDIIIAHFGGKYDFNFILREFFINRNQYFIHNMIPRGSGLLSFKVSTYTLGEASDADNEKSLIHKRRDGKWVIAKRTIEFRDSSALLPYSLGSLAENFGVDHQKLEIDYEKITKVSPELLKYLEHDCRALYECLETFYTQPLIKRAGAASTIASQALRVYRTFATKPIYGLSEAVDGFVRQSYFGGRTEIFKPFYIQDNDTKMLRCFDVNSLYPSVMRDFEFPNRPSFQTEIYMENQLGFYDVDVQVPDMYIPPLGTVFRENKHWGRYIFPTGRFRGVWTTAELNYAMTLGVKIIKVHSGIIFQSGGFIFKDYIEYLYDIRKKSKKGSVDDMVAKLLMNSTYGRFGLHTDREQLEFDYGQLGVEPFLEYQIEGNNYFRIMKRDVTLDNTFTNCAIASWVTSQARIRMHKLYMESPDSLYYTDTDSLFSTFKYPQNDNDLGQLKLEYKAKSACFLLPKTYAITGVGPYFDLLDSNGIVRDTTGRKVKTNVKIVMKGFDKKKISHFNTDDFYHALEGDLKRLRTTNPAKFATLKTAARNNEFLMLLNESPREIRSLYDKRRFIKVPGNQRYDSEPLHIKNGVIINKVTQLKKSKPRKANSPKIVTQHISL